MRTPSPDDSLAKKSTHELDTKYKARFFTKLDDRPEWQTEHQFWKQHKADEWCPRSYATIRAWIKWREQGIERRVGSQGMRGHASRLDMDSVIEVMAHGPEHIREHD